MFRKLTILMALVSLMALSACSSVTGPKTGPNNGRPASDPGPKPPQQFEKAGH